ncbi:MAG: hypothetical protein QGD94_09625 [Planctomycetia bacterium]|nr:hypothetical protein [Planctomycetia bacterium]
MARRILTLAAAILVLLNASGAMADEASDAFKKKYGKEFREVSATGGSKDDVALAGKLLAAAKAGPAVPGLQMLLCKKAYELGSKSVAGYQAALDAMTFAAEKFPEKRGYCQRKILGIHQRRFDRSKGAAREAAGEGFIRLLLEFAANRMGDDDFAAAAGFYGRAMRVAKSIKSADAGDVEAKFKHASALAPIGKRIVQLRARVKSDPKNAGLREQLILIYVMDLDRPADAAKLLSENVGERMRRVVPLAAKGPAALSGPQCLELADWYWSLSTRAPKNAKGRMLERAKNCYQQALAKGAGAREGLKKVEARLMGLLEADLRSGRWVDVLKLAKPPKYVKGGQWRWVKGGLRVEAHWSPDRIMIPVAIEGSYELRIKLTRVGRTDRVDVMFPVGPSWALLEMNMDKATGREPPEKKFSWLAGKEQTKITPGPLLLNKHYTVDIKTTLQGGKAFISVDVNGKKLIRWQGSPASMRLGEMWKLDNTRAIGLGAHWSVVIFHSLEVRTPGRKGRATILRDAKDK